MYGETFEDKDSVEATSYLHEQDLVSVFLTQMSASRGLREVNIISKHKLCTKVEETEMTQQYNHHVLRIIIVSGNAAYLPCLLD